MPRCRSNSMSCSFIFEYPSDTGLTSRDKASGDTSAKTFFPSVPNVLNPSDLWQTPTRPTPCDVDALDLLASTYFSPCTLLWDSMSASVFDHAFLVESSWFRHCHVGIYLRSKSFRNLVWHYAVASVGGWCNNAWENQRKYPIFTPPHPPQKTSTLLTRQHKMLLLEGTLLFPRPYTTLNCSWS